MLSNPFKRTEASSDYSSSNRKKSATELMIYGVIFLVVLVIFGLGGGMDKKEIKPSNNNDNEEKIEVSTVKESKVIENFLDEIKENYSLIIKVNDDSKLVYSKDKDIQIYESSLYEKNGYIKYDGDTYILTTDKLKKTETDETTNYFNNRYYDIELIKNIIKEADKVSDTGNTAIYNILLSSFLKEYNYLYETTYKTNVDKYIEITITYSDTQIRTIQLDYSYVEEVINGNTEELFYHISVSDVNKNDYSKFTTLIEK